MAHFSDLSKYAYFPHAYRQTTLNVGWLDSAHPFEKARPPKWLVQKLFAFTQCCVAPACGLHDCNLPNCPGPFEQYSDNGDDEKPGSYPLPPRLEELLRRTWTREQIERLKKPTRIRRVRDLRLVAKIPRCRASLYLGNGEIRVFGRRGRIYAAPSMLFHYVTEHHYKCPAQFVEACKESPCPPDPEYFDLLDALGVEWMHCSSSEPDHDRKVPLPLLRAERRAKARLIAPRFRSIVRAALRIKIPEYNFNH